MRASTIMQGHELRALRKSMGKTQGELADALGFSQGFIGEMERDEKAIEYRTELAVRMLEPLEPAVLIGGKGHGQLLWIGRSQQTLTISMPGWIAPFVHPNAPGVSAPKIAYRLIDLDGSAPERVFVPEDEEWSRDAVLAALADLRAKGQA